MEGNPPPCNISFKIGNNKKPINIRRLVFSKLHSLKGDKNTMKHKKMRGVVAMLLTLVMVVGMLPTSVYASDADGGGNSVVLESVSDLIEVSSVN